MRRSNLYVEITFTVTHCVLKVATVRFFIGIITGSKKAVS